MIKVSYIPATNQAEYSSLWPESPDWGGSPTALQEATPTFDVSKTLALFSAVKNII